MVVLNGKGDFRGAFWSERQTINLLQELADEESSGSRMGGIIIDSLKDCDAVP